MISILLFLLAFLCIPGGASATDADREARWAEQVQETLVVGQAVWLEAGGRKVFAVLTPAESAPPHGGVVLVHGMGEHPDWNDVIHPLRLGLAERGWTTLSVQMPVLAADASPTDYAPLIPESDPRLVAAVNDLRARKLDPVILVAHSLGTNMAIACLAQHPRLPLDGLVLIGTPRLQGKPPLDPLPLLARLTLPILDLYGSRDFDFVRGTAAARRKAVHRGGNRHYRQVQIEGADHYFRGLEDELVTTVDAWLERVRRDKGRR